MRYLLVIYLLLIILQSAMLRTVQAQVLGSTEARNIIKQLRSGIADTTRVQMLLKLSTFYFNKTLNPISDLDSAFMLASQARNLAQRLKFGSGLEEAAFLIGNIYIRQRKIVALKRMMDNVSNRNRIKLLMELGKSKLRTAYSENSDRDSAITYFREAGRLSDKMFNRELKEESQCLIGVVYLLNGNWPEGKAYFMQVVDARQKAGDKPGELSALLRMATTVFCDDCTENLTALNRALELSRQIGNQALEAVILLEIGFKHLNGGNARRAEQAALAALQIQKAVGYPGISYASKTLAQQSVYYTPSDYAYLSNAYYLLSDLSQ